MTTIDIVWYWLLSLVGPNRQPDAPASLRHVETTTLGVVATLIASFHIDWTPFYTVVCSVLRIVYICHPKLGRHRESRVRTDHLQRGNDRLAIVLLVLNRIGPGDMFVALSRSPSTFGWVKAWSSTSLDPPIQNTLLRHDPDELVVLRRLERHRLHLPSVENRAMNASFFHSWKELKFAVVHRAPILS